jgi:hypothetical protein
MNKVMYYGWEGSRSGRDTIKKPKTVTLKEANINKTHHNGFKLFDNEEDATAHYQEAKAEAEKTLAEHAEIVRTHLDAIAKSGIDFDIWVRVADDHNLSYGHMVNITINNFYFERAL